MIRMISRSCCGSSAFRRGLQKTSAIASSKRFMGGGGHPMQVGETHALAGEIFGVICWLWVFHRARHDLPVLLGWRHPWEHAHDPFEPHVHPPSSNERTGRMENWDKFMSKAVVQKETEEDDEEEDDE